ncbi:MAG: hypothetical protein RIR74_701, partial [Pseudomonadota bacterium]
MLLLDTNVLSEPLRPEPNPAVLRFLDSTPLQTQWVCCVSISEMMFGVLRLPEGRRRAALQASVIDLFENAYGQRCLSIDAGTAHLTANIRAARERVGKPISLADANIAACATQHNLALI